jgi:cold shock CspA family protein
MGRSQETFGKKEKEKKRLKKRKDKLLKKEERKANSSSGNDLDSMIAYTDEYGRISDTPADPVKRKKEIDSESIEISIPKQEKGETDSIRKGKVAFFNDSKGYGFIRDIQSDEKYFVHASGLLEEVLENDSVTFELEKGMKGMNAVRVQKV